MLDAQLVKLKTETNRHRRPPWILEVGLIFPRPGIDERVRFREIPEVPFQWERGRRTPDNFIFRESVKKDFILTVKLRRKRSGFWKKFSGFFKNAVGQYGAGSSPLQWYTIRDMLDAGERISGVREAIRAEHPADIKGFITIEEKEIDGEVAVPLFNATDWKNPLPRRHDPIYDRDYEEIIKPAGEQVGELKLYLRREI